MTTKCGTSLPQLNGLYQIITHRYRRENSMANENRHTVLSPTVLHVIEQFATAMRADAEIPVDAIDRLEKLFLKDAVPKPDDINAALFEPPPDGKL